MDNLNSQAQIFTWFLALLLVALYFLPGIIAGCRGAKNGAGIFFLTLLTGWSIVGWIAAFIWACVDKTRD